VSVIHQHTPSRSTLGLLQISAAGVLWGTGGLTLQVVREHAPLAVVTVSAWRLVIASVVLGACVLALRRGPAVVRLLREAPTTACLIGVSTAAYQGLYFASVTQVGVAVATAVSLGLAPVLLTVLDAVRSRRRPTLAALAVLATALAGLVAISVAADGSGAGPRPAVGVLLALASGTTYAATVALAQGLSRRADPVALTTVATAAGAVALVLAMLLQPGDPHLVTRDPNALVALAYLGTMTMALAYLLLYTGLRTTSGSVAVLASLLEPVTAAVLAVVVLDEHLPALGVVGIGLVVVALAASGLGTTAAPRPARPHEAGLRPQTCSTRGEATRTSGSRARS
jgi:DME family drug/metabolite transporter